MSRTRRETPLYGNCVIEAPDGQPLCRTSQHRIEWYLTRNLGEIVCENPVTLRLLFEPQGRDRARHPYTLAEKANVCVVCGSESEITRHHVVPRCFRKYFPLHLKNHAMYDVLILCVDCHNDYEFHAYKFKEIIAKEMGISLNEKPEIDPLFCGVKTAAHALFTSFDKIPEPRKTFLLNKLRDFFGKQEITMEDIVIVNNSVKTTKKVKTYGQMVVERLSDIREFILRWRRHFVETMKPRYLPAFWEIIDT
jgi:hypothetical protein